MMRRRIYGTLPAQLLRRARVSQQQGNKRSLATPKFWHRFCRGCRNPRFSLQEARNEILVATQYCAETKDERLALVLVQDPKP